MSKYILISDFGLQSRNRGTAALGYGAISFLKEKGYMKENDTIVDLKLYKRPIYKRKEEVKEVQGMSVRFLTLPVSIIEFRLLIKFGVRFRFSGFGRVLKKMSCVAAINGGDGFSDIYGTKMFMSRNPYSYIAIKTKIPLIILPQTIGPFKEKKNLLMAEKILKYAKKVYVRDAQFVDSLKCMGVEYEITKDLSAYMKPEPWDIDIKHGAIGINVSGLAYSNKFMDLAGKFNAYPQLIEKLICHFRDKGCPVYIIPHSYGFHTPEDNNDDLVASREVYSHLIDKTNVYLLDKDLISPQIKYVISRMSFFCGTRMHANFAAIYTGVPVFGLAYSYKFIGAFNNNGLDGDKQTIRIDELQEKNIDVVIEKVETFFQESIK